uniref:hypothetical protein n=1 Tax=Planomicrobium okeanokoites TaxID=244 RepID=UPI0030FC98C5
MKKTVFLSLALLLTTTSLFGATDNFDTAERQPEPWSINSDVAERQPEPWNIKFNVAERQPEPWSIKFN